MFKVPSVVTFAPTEHVFNKQVCTVSNRRSVFKRVGLLKKCKKGEEGIQYVNNPVAGWRISGVDKKYLFLAVPNMEVEDTADGLVEYVFPVKLSSLHTLLSYGQLHEVPLLFIEEDGMLKLVAEAELSLPEMVKQRVSQTALRTDELTDADIGKVLKRQLSSGVLTAIYMGESPGVGKPQTLSARDGWRWPFASQMFEIGDQYFDEINKQECSRMKWLAYSNVSSVGQAEGERVTLSASELKAIYESDDLREIYTKELLEKYFMLGKILQFYVRTQHDGIMLIPTRTTFVYRVVNGKRTQFEELINPIFQRYKLGVCSFKIEKLKSGFKLSISGECIGTYNSLDDVISHTYSILAENGLQLTCFKTQYGHVSLL